MPVDFHAEADGVEAKILYNLFRSLFKIGNEIEMEMTRDKLYFKTFNEAKTIFCNTYFDSSFFKQFEASDDIEVCSIQLKTAISMFRGHASIESFRIDLDCSNSELIFNFRCRNGVRKTFTVFYCTREPTKVCYSKQDCQNSIEFEARYLNNVLSSFHSNVEEISFITSSDDIHLKSSYDRPENGNSSISEMEMRTQTSISARDLVSFRVQQDIKVCFAVKELKDIVSFCNKTCLKISLKYQNDARCLIFTADKEDLLMTIDFVIAASDPDEDLDSTSDSNSRGASQVVQAAPSNRNNFAHFHSHREPLLTNDSIVSAATSESVLSHRDSDEEQANGREDSGRVGARGSVSNGTDIRREGWRGPGEQVGAKRKEREESATDYSSEDEVIPATPSP